MLLTRSNRGMYKVPLTGAIRPIRDLGACRDNIIGHNTGISLLYQSTSVWVLLSPSNERLNVPVHRTVYTANWAVTQHIHFCKISSSDTTV